MALNTAMNAIGTAVALKSLLGGGSSSPGGKLSKFMAEIREASVARTNLFDVTMTAPRILSGSPVAEKISLYAEGAQLPGLNIQTDDSIKRFGIGPQDNSPYSSGVNDITLSFIGDGRGDVYKFFYRWMQGIVRSDYNVSGVRNGYNGLAPYEVEFKREYETTINIKTYNEQGDVVFDYKLLNAFPKSLPDISLSWDDSGMMKFSVTFCYLQAELGNVDQPLALTKNGLNQLTPFQKLVKIGTAVQTIASLKRPGSVQDALASATTIKNIF